MSLADTSDYIGKIDPSTRTSSRVDCMECSKTILDEAPAFVYFDISVSTYYLTCEDCHRAA